MMTKPLHTGKAASNGVLAALLAKRGFNGATRILEGEKGFCNATSTDWSFDKVLPTLGEHFNVADTTFKAYASCGHTHPAIDCTFAIVRDSRGEAGGRGEHPGPHLLGGPQRSPATLTPRPPTRRSSASPTAWPLPFGSAGSAWPSSPRSGCRIPRRWRLCGGWRWSRILSSALIAPAKRPAIVADHHESGQSYTHRVDFRKGDPENPPTLKELEDKFRDLASATLSTAEIEATLAAIGRIEETADVSSLLRK